MAVIEHVLSRLNDIGVTDVFPVPGDFAFPVNDTRQTDTRGSRGWVLLGRRMEWGKLSVAVLKSR
jgi:TPP-dependent 2-oxoacid decarboxylase